MIFSNCFQMLYLVYNLLFPYTAVGGGTAGSVLAARLSANPRFKVLMIEAGEPETGRKESAIMDIPSLHRMLINTSIDWQYLTKPQDHAGLGFNDKVIIPHLKSLLSLRHHLS